MSFRRLAAVAAAVVVFGCKPTTDSPVATSIDASPDPITLLSVGQTQQITAVVKDQNGNNMSGVTLSYSSNTASVATVSGSGLVTAVTSGTATITISGGGLNETVSVTVTQTAATLSKTQGDAQTQVENALLPQAIKVKVSDALNNAVAGVTVTFAIQGGGTLNDSSLATNAAGEVTVAWTLGPSGQTQQLTASSGTLTPVVFTATAVSASSLVITKFVGDGQTALVGFATNVRPAVRVTNFAGTPVPGINVTFGVTGGGGSITGGTTIATNANGVAQLAGWTVGGAAGPNTMTATGAGTYVGSSSVTFNATGQTAQFNIVIRNAGPALSPAVQAAFDSAEARWERIIFGDIQDIASFNANDVCFTGNNMNEAIDDIVILVRFDSIDGPGQVLGSAGDCGYLRNAGALPVAGQMRFDTADVANMVTNGTLPDVILHEMGHVLGFSGGRFDLVFGNVNRDCIDLQTSGTPPNVVSQDTHYKCAAARAVFDSIGGTSYTGGNRVPLENCGSGVPASCSGGTYNGHWREPAFFNELMTGYINSGTLNPLSVITISVFGDLGYTVNYGAAAGYTRTFTAPAAQRGPLIHLGNDIIEAPIVRFIDASGRVVGTVRRQ